MFRLFCSQPVVILQRRDEEPEELESSGWALTRTGGSWEGWSGRLVCLGVDPEGAIFEKNWETGPSLVVQWLRLWVSTAGGQGLIPGWGTKNLHALQCNQKKKEKNLEINKEKKLFPMLALSYGFEEGVCLFTGVFVWATFAFIFYWREYYFLVDASRKHF